MAIAATTMVMVESGASDSSNGGAFDPGQTAGMFTDGAATSATGASPVFTSASYNFVAGDVNAWIFIASGTNWLSGYYKIVSVAANAATLSAAAGAAARRTTGTLALAPSTTAGCATTASPTGATWSINYAWRSTAGRAYTDLASAGAGLTVSSAAFPFGAQMVGNGLIIDSGTNFTAGYYVIASVAAGVATVLGAANITTGAGASGVGGMGGALGSPGRAGGFGLVANNSIYIKSGTYPVSNATPNVTLGCLSVSVGIYIEGYQTVPGDLGTKPLLQASGIATFVLVTQSGTSGIVNNLRCDGAGLTSSRAFALRGIGQRLLAENCTNGGFAASAGNPMLERCVATGCSTVIAFANMICNGCIAHTNTVSGFTIGGAGVFNDCLAYNNSGATSDGFQSASSNPTLINCTAYGNGRDGIRISSAGGLVVNPICEGNAGIGILGSSSFLRVINPGVYNNTGGDISVGTVGVSVEGTITATSTFFTNAAGADFSLNNVSTGGALARAAGIPGILPAGSTVGYKSLGAVQNLATLILVAAQMIFRKA